MVKPRNVVPALKDKIINFPLKLGTPPTFSSAVMFMDLWYDYQLMSIAALVDNVTQAVACAFTLGYGSYTDQVSGSIIAANPVQYLAAANCLDINGQPFSTAILPVGTMNFIPVQADPTGLGLNILPACAPLIVTVPTVSNSGEVTLNLVLRPKELDRGDSSKRPWGAADEAYASYYKT